MVSLAPLSNILAYKKRMGWSFPWFSSSESDFNVDFGVTAAEGETSGTSVFLRDEGRVFRTYFTTGRGDENARQFLDLPRSDAAWPPGELGRFPRGLAAVGAICVVAPA
jgi:predicted dithiol-disulfide oxidoreductase (DUF899 family)